MQFLKENKRLLYITIIMPFFIFYLDKLIILWILSLHRGNLKLYSILEYIDPLINFIGNGATLVIISLMFYLLGRYLNQRLYDAGKSMFIGFVSAGIVVQILKHLIGRARPRLTVDPVFIGPSWESGYDSFPSGHTAVAFCLACILSQHFPKYRFIFYLFAIVVGFERFEDVSHFPSDVMAGAVVGIIIGKLLPKMIFHTKGEQYAGVN